MDSQSNAISRPHMNHSQQLWWEQAKSDHIAFEVVRRQGLAECHALHYLQMTTEKLAKAYFWGSGHPPAKSHAGFVRFLRFLGLIRRPRDRERVAEIFSFNRFTDFQNWIRSVLPIAYQLENLAPDLPGDSENPEYPWPHDDPVHAPANYPFPVWKNLKSTASGRALMSVIQIAVDRFPEYADT